ncbi:metal ABC transporter solute-binding protein, Zn/Mn family, partial [Marinobacter alexandrii]
PAMAESDHADEHDEYGHEDEDHHDEGHGHHDHGEGEDPHIWLDPALAEQMVEKMHKAMARQPDADTDALGRNLKQFKTRMAATEAEIRAKLEPARDISLFAYHDAFVRFAEHYGLKLEGVLTLNPELTPGARHIARIQDQLGQGHHPCLLTEPQFNPGIWEVITEDLDVTFSVWDPLGTDVEEGPEGYFEFQHSIADAVLNCLPEQAEH